MPVTRSTQECMYGLVLAHDNDNDNDNDTLREVPHLSDEGLALQARASGPWPHEKESVLQVKLALLARCKINLLRTE